MEKPTESGDFPTNFPLVDQARRDPSRDRWATAHRSERHEWRTPPDLLVAVRQAWGFAHFDLDAAASPENAVCADFHTEADNALAPEVRWTGRVWCNPPYGRGVGDWLRKAAEEARRPGCEGVWLLTFARTDTRWWHEGTASATSVALLKGRLAFGDPVTGKPGAGAPAPSALIHYSGAPGPGAREPRIYNWDWRRVVEHLRVHRPDLFPAGPESRA